MSIFNQVQLKNPKYNVFNLSHDRKFSMKFGELVPTLCLEAIPGDVFKLNTAQLVRFSPMIAPIMHEVNIYNHYFFVPNRIVWENWDTFISGGESGLEEPAFPELTFPDAIANGSLADYLGLPANIPQSNTVNGLPFAAYQAIYNEYFRDQNLVTEVDYQLVDGENNTNTDLSQMRNRAWQHDYFTSALPFTQKGPEATIPIQGTADINFAFNGADTIWNATDGTPDATSFQGGTQSNQNIRFNGGVPQYDSDGLATTYKDFAIDNSQNLNVDLTSATATTINELRQAVRLQEWLERNARAGTRYTEFILAHFGTHTGDARLDRPEYIGGGKTPLSISEVLQNTQTLEGSTPQGNMAGHGIGAGRSGRNTYKCKEHGFIISVMSVLPKATYQQGTPKMFKKFDKFDYYFESFAHLGEQPIRNDELYFSTDGQNGDTFGYTPRYAEYKYIPSTVHGEFRSSLDFWHMGRKFTSRPTLSKEFIEMTDSEVERVFAVQESEKLYVQLHNSVKARRGMPYFATPYL